MPSSRLHHWLKSLDVGSRGCQGRTLNCGRGENAPRAVILVIVLVVIAVLALSAYTFCDLMLAHHGSADSYLSLSQTHSLLHSGAAATRTVLMQPPEVQLQQGGVYNNPLLFQSQIVVPDGDPAFQAAFSIVAPVFDNQGNPIGLRFGLQNESAKLNLNSLVSYFESVGGDDSGSPEQQAASSLVSSLTGADPDADEEEEVEEDNRARDALMFIPGMTLEIADSILDWIDEDDEPREYGAELEYYSGQTPPYAPRNGRINTLDELLLVRGVTPELLFGRDQNRNGRIEENELNYQFSVPYDPTLGSLDLGWRPYLTTDSREQDLDPLGGVRIDLNSENLETLHADLSAVVDPDVATFVVAFRQNGAAPPPTDENGETQEIEPGESVGGRNVDLTQPGQNQISSVLDLIDINVNTTFENDSEPTSCASPFFGTPDQYSEQILTLLDYATTTSEGSEGRINVNLAPRPVLLAVPGMTVELADIIASQILAGGNGIQSQRRHAIWLYLEGQATLDELKEIMPYITGGGSVFRAHIVGHFADGSRVSRAEVVFDATQPDVPIVGWKDMTSAGRGFLREDLMTTDNFVTQ